MRINRRLANGIALALLAGSAIIPARGTAQGVSVWAGMGSSSQNGNTQFGTNARQVGVQLGFPLLPIAVRGEALLLGTDIDTNALSYSVNGILTLPLPFVQPYAIAGRGRYALSLTQKTYGTNLGAGVKLGFGRLGFFGEVRWHRPLDRTIKMIGVTF
jgi:hypothetical protein